MNDNIEELNINQKLRKINTLRRDIEMLKSERDQKLGEIKSLNDRLRHDFGIEGGIEGAKRKIKALEVAIDRRNTSVEKKLKELSEKYDF